MGLWDAINREVFIDIIEWLEADDSTLACRYDRKGNDIRNGAQLTVREGQTAVFVSEGQLADIFGPGMHELSTENLPILSRLKGWKYGFKSPFKAEVYFISSRIVTGFFWGTPSPFMLRDPDFGILKVMARGEFSLHVLDPGKFLKNVVGTEGEITKSEITDRLRRKFITEAQSAIAEMRKPFYQMAEHLDDLSEELKNRIELVFVQDYGLSLDQSNVQSIELAEESMAKVEKRDEVFFNDGRMSNYERQARADALRIMAGNPGPGGLAAGGMGMGMGLAMANQMGGMMGANPMGVNPALMGAGMAGAGMAGAAGAGAVPPPPPGEPVFHILVQGQQQGPVPASQLPALAQQGILTPETLVWKPGMAAWAAAGTLPELAGLFAPPPGSVPPPPPPV